MGDFGDDQSASAGDLAYITDDIPEQDKVYTLTNSFNNSGEKFSLIIPQDKKFVITRIALVPSNIKSNLKLVVNADILFADILIGNLFYGINPNNTTDKNSHDFINPLSLHGDGKRKLTIKINSNEYDKDFEVSLRILVMGFYRDSNNYKPNKVVKIAAEELSPDIIKLTLDAPLDNGGKSITGYEIHRSSPDDSNFTLHYSFNNPPEKESDIKYVDGSVASPLADNTTYYYKVKPITAEGAGEFSEIVSAITEIDHPYSVTNLTAEKINPSSIRLGWNASLDSGGVPIQGYHIQKRSKTKQGDIFKDVIKNTKNQITTYNDSSLLPDIFEYRVKAINDDDKESLAWSDTAIILLTYAAPSNIRYELSSDKKSVTVKWDPTSDVSDDIAHGYQVERSLDNITFSTLSTSNNNQRRHYTDNIIDGGKVYYYRIAVLVNSVIGHYSQTLRVVTPNRVASAPQHLKVSAISHSKIKVTFDKPLDDGGLPVTVYELWRSESIGFPDGVGGSTFEKKVSPALKIHGQGVIASNITISDAQKVTVGSVQVDVDIKHEWRGDVEIALVAPNGTSITLKTSDLTDEGNNIIKTYSGDIFNDLIGIDSKGIWSLKIKDVFSEQDDGTLNSWTLRVEPALNAVTKISILKDLIEYIDNVPKYDTTYFYRIRAKTDVGYSHFSSTENTTTFKTMFGHGVDDLVIPANQTYNIISDKEYKNITINDGAILYVSNAILKCEKYQEIGSGHIEVKPTGCPGGAAGITHRGVGSYGQIRKPPGRKSRIYAVTVAAVPAKKTPATSAVQCTDLQAVSVFINDALKVDTFEAKFKNKITGGQGSDGTAAETSGNGGSKGRNGRYSGSASTLIRLGGRGGSGGLAAQGVRGGGKLAIFISNIINNITIKAKGNIGNNGLQGTAAPGSPGGKNTGCARNSCSTDGSAGSTASAAGTKGSEGSEGGLVFLVYDDIPDVNNISIDVSGGLGGYDGALATASSPLLSTKAATGPNGVQVIKSLAELT